MVTVDLTGIGVDRSRPLAMIRTLGRARRPSLSDCRSASYTSRTHYSHRKCVNAAARILVQIESYPRRSFQRPDTNPLTDHLRRRGVLTGGTKRRPIAAMLLTS